MARERTGLCLVAAVAEAVAVPSLASVEVHYAVAVPSLASVAALPLVAMQPLVSVAVLFWAEPNLHPFAKLSPCPSSAAAALALLLHRVAAARPVVLP